MATLDLRYYDEVTGQWEAPLANGVDLDALEVLLGQHFNATNPHNVTKSQVGLANVDNTSDVDKPISTATQQALAGKADANSLAPIYQEIDAVEQQVTAHLDKSVADVDGVHGLKIEEGVFTPYIGASAVDGNHSYVNQIGNYYKVGKLVWVTIQIELSAIDATMNGSLLVRGLPFGVATYQAANIGIFTNVNIPPNHNTILLSASDGYIQPLFASDTNGALSVFTKESINNNTFLMATMIYKTNF